MMNFVGSIPAEYVFPEGALYHHFLEGAHSSERVNRLKHFLLNVMNKDTHFVALRHGNDQCREMS